MLTGQKFVFRAMCFPTSSCRLESVMHSNRASLFQIQMILCMIFMIIWSGNAATVYLWFQK